MIAFSRSSGSIFHVVLSESIKTGFAPRYVIGLDEAQNVNDCTQTSSPAFTPQATRARCIAAVPALKHTTFLSRSVPSEHLLAKSARFCSNALTFGPIGTTQLVSNASFTYFCSYPSSLMCARQRYIVFLSSI